MAIPYCTANNATMLARKEVDGIKLKTINNQSIKGDGNISVSGSTVSVSTTGTASDDVKYITIDGTEHRMATNAYQPFPTSFNTTGTTVQFAQSVLAYDGFKVGTCWHGELYCTDLPCGIGNIECTVTALKTGLALIEMSSSNVQPFYWQYNTDSYNRGTGLDGWKYIPCIDSSKFPADATTTDVYTVKCKKLASGGWEFYLVKD